MHAHALKRESWLPAKVTKRDGAEVDFKSDKIQNAILKAGEASGEFNGDEAGLLTAHVIKVLSHTGYRELIPSIERIQDIVEQVLISANHLKTARAYIVYREQHKKLREDRRTLLDVSASVSEYLQRTDWRVSANANQGYSLGGLILNASGKMIANYWLNHVYPPEIGEAHRTADIHIHD
ncbi:MAG: anaerobic ribonucleoside-triphosphate reductase, partial [Candidatus Thiodiazotropha sp.]